MIVLTDLPPQDSEYFQAVLNSHHFMMDDERIPPDLVKLLESGVIPKHLADAITEHKFRLPQINLAYINEYTEDICSKIKHLKRVFIDGPLNQQLQTISGRTEGLVIVRYDADFIVSSEIAQHLLHTSNALKDSGLLTLREAANLLSAQSGRPASSIKGELLEANLNKKLVLLESDGFPTKRDNIRFYSKGVMVKKEEINAWLELIGSPIHIELTTATTTQEKHIPKAARQEQAILKELESLGHTPAKLPKQISGKKWVKSEVKGTLLKDRLDLFSPSSFKKAWERLSKEGRIAEVS